MSRLSITWLGHSTFVLGTPGRKRVLLDPWLTSNPACPASLKAPPRADLILVSHGHSDHMADAVACARASGAPVVASYELSEWLHRKGVSNTIPMNKGGAVDIIGLRVTMTDARHSSGYLENGQMMYMGEPAGYIMRLEDGMTLYFAGDTSVFGDMKLIRELYAPTIAFLPVGDRFTMGPREAAMACDLLGIAQVVPMHHGTFPLLTGTPEELQALVEPRGVQVLTLRPGETSE